MQKTGYRQTLLTLLVGLILLEAFALYQPPWTFPGLAARTLWVLIPVALLTLVSYLPQAYGMLVRLLPEKKRVAFPAKLRDFMGQVEREDTIVALFLICLVLATFMPGLRAILLPSGMLLGILTLWHGRKRVLRLFSRRKARSTLKKYHPLLLAGLALLVLVIYFLHIPTMAFIYTDEPRLLYDAELILEGKTPFEDFNARAPLIIYLLAPYLALVGNSLVPFYVLSALLATLTVTLLYLLAQRLFGKELALLAAGLFAIAPIMINLLHVKTQSFQLPLVLGALILYDKYLAENRWWQVLASGALMLLAFFCRESTIFFFAAIALLILHRTELTWKSLRKPTLVFVLYAMIILVLFVGITATFFTYKSGVINSPTAFSLSINEQSQERFKLIPHYLSPAYLMLLLISLGILPLLFRARQRQRAFSYLLPVMVVLSLAVGYLYNTLRHGFWPQYLMEFAPFYALLVAVTVVALVKAPSRKALRIAMAVLLVAFIIAANVSSYVFIKEYKGVYHRAGTERVAEYLNEHSTPGDVILGGNPVYAFLTEQEHFMNLSHIYYSKESAALILARMEADPPRYIINDHYFSRYTLSRGNFSEYMHANYRLAAMFSATSYGKPWNAQVWELEGVSEE